MECGHTREACTKVPDPTLPTRNGHGSKRFGPGIPDRGHPCPSARRKKKCLACRTLGTRRSHRGPVVFPRQLDREFRRKADPFIVVPKSGISVPCEPLVQIGPVGLRRQAFVTLCPDGLPSGQRNATSKTLKFERSCSANSCVLSGH